jgi:acyl-CoA thioester hydrolase
MPRVYTVRFPVRHYECDAYGHVNHANYLRYMQEAAFGASAVVGFTPQRYAELGIGWLAYETDIEYIQPLVYGDTATVRTWVQDFRRVRSLRHYEIYNDEMLCARSWTDWVLIDNTTGRPISIPADVVAAYSDGETPIMEERTKPLPVLPPPKTGIFTLQRRVEWRDMDPVGHVNNAIYLHYAADCGMQVARHYGWSLDRLREMNYGNVARRHFIEYKSPALLDDTLTIRTWLSDMRRASAVRHYLINRVADNKLLARVRTMGVWINLETKSPARIPKAYKEAIAENLVE